MIKPHQIEQSAANLIAELGPDGVDRTTYFPVVALAAWTTDDRLALTNMRGQHQPGLPMSTWELPVVATRNPAKLRAETCAIIRRILPDSWPLRVRTVFAFGSNIDDGGLMLPGDEVTVDGQSRRVLFLPLGMLATNHPQLNASRINWLRPSYVLERLAPGPSSALKRLILTSLLDHPQIASQRPLQLS